MDIHIICKNEQKSQDFQDKIMKLSIDMNKPNKYKCLLLI